MNYDYVVHYYPPNSECFSKFQSVFLVSIECCKSYSSVLSSEFFLSNSIKSSVIYNQWICIIRQENSFSLQPKFNPCDSKKPKIVEQFPFTFRHFLKIFSNVHDLLAKKLLSNDVHSTSNFIVIGFYDV